MNTDNALIQNGPEQISYRSGHDSGIFDWFFSLMRDNGAKYNVIGMSLYPSWWENGGWSDWKQTDGVWKPSNYTDLGWNAYNMGAFRDGRPTMALDPFKN